MIRCLSIGCNKFDRLTKLKYCEEDALLFSSTVEEIGSDGEPECNVVPSPNLEEFKNEFNNFLSSVTSDDRVVLFFGGHGFSLDGEDRLAMRDSDPNEPTSFISVSWLIDALHEKQAKAAIFIDACRERASSRKMTGSRNEFGRSSMTKAASVGVVLFFSCSPGQLAWEFEIEAGKGQGVFTHLMCQTLREVKHKTSIEIDDHIQRKAKVFYTDHPELDIQTPFSSAQPVGLADVDIITGERGNILRPSRGRILIISGPSNAGKTSLGQQVANTWKCQHAEMSSFAYRRYKDFLDNEPNADMSIQDFMENEVWKDRNFDAIAQDFLNSYQSDHDYVLSGLRRPEELEELRSHINNIDIVFLFANARIRFDRHRENEGYKESRMGTTYREFVKRDMKEFSWGMSKIQSMDRSKLILNEADISRMMNETLNYYPH